MPKVLERVESSPRVFLINFNRVRTREEQEAITKRNRHLYGMRGGTAARKKDLEMKKIYGEFYSIFGKKKYPTPEELAIKVQEYFLDCYGPVFSKTGIQIFVDGKPLKQIVKPMTISGLAAYLGWTTLTLKNYIKFSKQGKYDPKFGEIMLLAFQECEAYAAGRLFDMSGNKGAMFILEKMHGWKTEKEVQELKTMVEKRQMMSEEHKLKMKLLGEEDKESLVSEIVIRRAKKEDLLKAPNSDDYEDE